MLHRLQTASSSLSGSEAGEDDEDDCMSEEVVSNTVGLSMPQPSGFSGPQCHLNRSGRAVGDRDGAMRAANGKKLQGQEEAEATYRDVDDEMGEVGMDEVMSGPTVGLVGQKRVWGA